MREFHRAPRGYELMVLINPEVTDEALTATIDAVSGYVTATGSEITYVKRDTPWGRRRLAYPIQRFRDATYVLIQFLASPTDLSDIERELKLDERVIRYLLVRQENLHVPDEEEESTEQGEVSTSGESDEEHEGEESSTQDEESETEESSTEDDESDEDEDDSDDEDDDSDEGEDDTDDEDDESEKSE